MLAQPLLTHLLTRGSLLLRSRPPLPLGAQRASICLRLAGSIISPRSHSQPRLHDAFDKHCHTRSPLDLGPEPGGVVPSVESMARRKLNPRRVIWKPTRAKQAAETSAALRVRPRIAAALHPPNEVFVSEHGVRAEVLRLGCQPPPPHSLVGDEAESSAKSASMHTHVIVLPGNPCIIDYYRPTLRMLHERLPQDVKERTSLHALGMPGHDLRELNSTALFKISDHIEFCRSYLHSEEFHPPIEESKLVVVGHSYGSFLGLRLLESLGASLTARSSIVMLMPALYQMGQCAGAATRFLLQDKLWSTSGAAWAVSAMTPPFVRSAILRVLGHDPSLVEISERVVDGRRRGLYLNICSLARDEVKQILEPHRLGAVQQLGSNTLFVHADGDKWCPPIAVERIIRAFGENVTTEWAGPGVKHAFVLHRDQTESVVKIVAPWITQFTRRE